jgi:hypothetical protein
MRNRATGDNTPIPWWVIGVATVGSLLMIVGGLLALIRPEMLLSPHQEVTQAVRIYAGYLASRNLALGVMLLAILGLRASRALHGFMILFALIQFLDISMDCTEARWTIVPGILALSVLFLLAAARISGHPFWRPQAWR